MPRHFEYLSKAKTQGITGTLGSALAGVIPQMAYLPPFAGGNEWAHLAGELWRRRSEAEGLSIGVFPCGEAEDHGWFAARLALFLRQMLDRETLLIDLDSGHSALATTMRTPDRPGLSELLNSSPVAQLGCLHETAWSRVYLLPQGGAARNFDWRETGRRLRCVHTTVQRDFPVVITRFPRVNQSRALRDCCNIPEMAVLTVTPGLSRKSELRRDTKALRAAGANLIGLVFTGSKSAGARNLFIGATK